MVVTTLEATMNMMQLKYVPEYNQWATLEWCDACKVLEWKRLEEAFEVVSETFTGFLVVFFGNKPTNGFLYKILSTRNAKKDNNANVADHDW